MYNFIEKGDEVMYCKHCGNKVEDEAVVCVKCGCIVDETAFRQVQQKNRNVSNEYYNDTVMAFVKLLLVISCVIPALFALPFWRLRQKAVISKHLGSARG